MMFDNRTHDFLKQSLTLFPAEYASQQVELNRFLDTGQKTKGSRLPAPLASRAVKNGLTTAFSLMPIVAAQNIDSIDNIKLLDEFCCSLSLYSLHSSLVESKLQDMLIKTNSPLHLSLDIKEQDLYVELFSRLLKRFSKNTLSEKPIPANSLLGYAGLLDLLVMVPRYLGRSSGLFLKFKSTWEHSKKNTGDGVHNNIFLNNIFSILGGVFDDDCHLIEEILNPNLIHFRLQQLLRYTGKTTILSYAYFRFKSPLYKSLSITAMQLSWLDFSLSEQNNYKASQKKDLLFLLETSLGQMHKKNTSIEKIYTSVLNKF